MGLIRGNFLPSNPTGLDLAPLEVSALADSGAVHLCIPEHLANQLNLGELEQRQVILADGRRRTVPYVGPVEVRFRNRRCFTGAMVQGNEVLLGAIPMEDMDLVLRPQLQSIDMANCRLFSQHLLQALNVLIGNLGLHWAMLGAAH